MLTGNTEHVQREKDAYSSELDVSYHFCIFLYFYVGERYRDSLYILLLSFEIGNSGYPQKTKAFHITELISLTVAFVLFLPG